ncbi:Eco29kI family restriction endonuclease [Variovorax sp. E3]|uniref:Eco29kI family restriction endonuclease n=1 Tax=Variovorax sp. E3 TaxID=1914993 RepID=UPI0035B18036
MKNGAVRSFGCRERRSDTSRRTCGADAPCTAACREIRGRRGLCPLLPRQPPRLCKARCFGWGEGGGKYPVYIGSAVRENVKQGFSPRPTSQARLWTRLGHHGESIREVQDAGLDAGFRLEDFRCRFLALNDAYVTLAESVLIATFRPAWNGMGFGSKVVGVRREGQIPSLWDSLHPGRGGRPAGNVEQRAKAEAKIQESIDKLSELPSDPRSAKMMEKIKRFL